MLYTEFIKKAMDETITQADNGLFYLEPMWKMILHDNELFFDEVSDFQITPEETFEVLRLEVEKRKTIFSKKNDVIEWIYEVISNTVEPAILAEETDFVKNVVDFMRVNHSTNKTSKDELKSGDYDGDNIIPFPTQE